MPTYEYKCTQCENQFDIWQAVGSAAPPCPECEGQTKKVFRPIRTIFKGSGFYLTDTRAESGKGEKAEAKSDEKTDKTETKSETKSETASETKSEGKSESKAESKPESKSETAKTEAK